MMRRHFERAHTPAGLAPEDQIGPTDMDPLDPGDARAGPPADVEGAFQDALHRYSETDHFEFSTDLPEGRPAAENEAREATVDMPAPDPAQNTGRDDPSPLPETEPEAQDPDPAPPPVVPPEDPGRPTAVGRPEGATPGVPQILPPSPAPGTDNSAFGRAPDAEPDLPDTGVLTTYTSGGAAGTSYNVQIDFEGTWTTGLQQAFVDAAEYLSSIILGDLPDAIVDGVVVDDIIITATLEAIDGTGGVLGSAGPRDLRNDGTLLPVTGAMRFDIEDANTQLGFGNWETIVLHEMMHALGYGTLWGLLGLTTGSVAGGDLRFTGPNAVSVYGTEFPEIASSDPGAGVGIPIETDGGPGTAGGHWDELLFEDEIMTGFVDQGAFVSVMTIASLEDVGYDTVFDNPNDPNDLTAPIPPDPLMDMLV